MCFSIIWVKWSCDVFVAPDPGFPGFPGFPGEVNSGLFLTLVSEASVVNTNVQFPLSVKIKTGSCWKDAAVLLSNEWMNEWIMKSIHQPVNSSGDHQVWSVSQSLTRVWSFNPTQVRLVTSDLWFGLNVNSRKWRIWGHQMVSVQTLRRLCSVKYLFLLFSE